MSKRVKSGIAAAFAFCVSVMVGLSAWADPVLPTASVRQLTAAELAAWNGENPYGLPVVDMSGPYDAHSVGKAAYVSAGYCKADVGFVFQANTDEKASDFDNWWVDYVVYVDKPVAKNSMGLVGYYQQWGVSLGFFAPMEIPANANAKIPLLNSVMKKSNWNYGQIRDNVTTFKCGAFNLAAANNDTTLTVELRIFHPDMTTDQIRDPATWTAENTHVITTHTYKLADTGTLPPGEGHGPLTCTGIAEGTSGAAVAVPAGYFYLEPDTGLFVKSDGSSYTVNQKVAYFTEAHVVAKIGTVGFSTLADAIAAARDGDTIVLTEANSEVIAADTAKAFMIDPNGQNFVQANITPKAGCEFVALENGVYSYRMQVTVKDVVTKNVVETKVETETDTAAVVMTDETIEQLFPTEGAKTLDIVASGVGTVSFNPTAVSKIGSNIKEVIAAAGGEETSATAKTTVTVSIADVTNEEPKESKPTVIIEAKGADKVEHEVVQAISVTAIMQTIVTQQGASASVTNEEVFASARAAGVSVVTIPYSGIAPQVWYVDTAVTPWETNKMPTAYNAANKQLSFTVPHFSDYVITDAEVLAAVGLEKFATLAEAFSYVNSTPAADGATIRLTRNCEIQEAVMLAAGKTAVLDLNGKKLSWATTGAPVKMSGLVVNNGTLTICDNNVDPLGEMDAGEGNVFTTCGTGATTSILKGKYTGAFPTPADPATTNAGPIFVSGGAFYTPEAIPSAYWAVGYKANDATVAPFGVADCEIYIRDITAAQRYPWNGYVDVDFVVRWHRTAPARLFIFAYDKNNVKLPMTQTTLLDPVGNPMTGSCDAGYLIEAMDAKSLHLMWSSTEAVPLGTKREDISFEFIAK